MLMKQLTGGTVGGGGGLDLSTSVGSPLSATSDRNDITVTVTQTPRYIVGAQWTSDGGGQYFVIDVANNTAKRGGYWSTTTHTWEDFTSWTDFVTVTSSLVTFKKSAWGSANTRGFISCYY